MKLVASAGTIATLIVSALLNTACAQQVQRQSLPRSFGPATLGMTIEDFTRTIKVTPNACPNCADNEMMADLYLDDHPGVFPKTENPQNPNAVQFNFYKGKLYKIDLPRESRKIDDIKKTYTQKFGAVTKIEDWKNGVSWLLWENDKTVLAISYVRETNDRSSFDPSETKGTVLGIQYFDKSLRDSLTIQEKNKPTSVPN